MLEGLADLRLVPRTGGDAFTKDILELATSLREQASLTVLRGLLALERGETAEAARLFRLGQRVWDDGGEGPASLARHYLGLLEATRPRNPGPRAAASR
jgi:hypothetical protein